MIKVTMTNCVFTGQKVAGVELSTKSKVQLDMTNVQMHGEGRGVMVSDPQPEISRQDIDRLRTQIHQITRPEFEELLVRIRDSEPNLRSEVVKESRLVRAYSLVADTAGIVTTIVNIAMSADVKAIVEALFAFAKK